MDKLQHVQNAAARLVTGTRKYERGLSTLMHDVLHWLVIPQRVQYKLAVTVHHCLEFTARLSEGSGCRLRTISAGLEDASVRWTLEVIAH